VAGEYFKVVLGNVRILITTATLNGSCNVDALSIKVSQKEHQFCLCSGLLWTVYVRKI